MDLDLMLAVGGSEAVSLLCLVGLWRGQDGTASKVLWSVVVLLPFFGPLAYAVWHDPPASSDFIDRPPPVDGL